ncbi:MAG TPA: serine/threonine protein kinase, partial [Polyangiaceae bacterium]|nr:serine/threonine protein kinase [Polyangiaceae bacterium]
VSVSFPAGTFSGAFFRGPDKLVRFQVSRVVGPKETLSTHYDPTKRTGLVVDHEEHTSYDPRERDFYKTAVAAGGPTFTAPYPFFKSHVTGITYAEPIFEPDGSLHAVITIDFDVEALSGVLSSAPAPEGSLLVLHDRKGTILALPHVDERFPDLVFPEGRPLQASDIRDPILDALVAGNGPDGTLRALDVDGRRYLAMSEPAGAAQGLTWAVSVAIPEQRFLGELPALEQKSILTSSAAVAIAIGISFLFARHITRARREVAKATERAAVAEVKVRELGSYKLVSRIGKGGMGEVWRAEHRLLARPAALKLIRFDAKASKEDLAVAAERFRREAKTLAALESTHTVKVFDYGASTDGTLFLAMELLHGVDLDRLVEKNGPQPAARVISILIQALGSLAEAHDAGIVHRDIKPANLFLSCAADELDIVKVLDFGLVRVAREGERDVDPPPSDIPTTETTLKKTNGDDLLADAALTSKEGFLGTPHYMAPEQVRHKPVDGRADLYALGCVAFYLLTGRDVFESPTPAVIMVAHMTKPPPALAPLVAGWLPAGLATVIEMALQKEPAKRPATARAMRDLLVAIDIPAEHAWTRARAEAWWTAWGHDKPAPPSENPEILVAQR